MAAITEDDLTRRWSLAPDDAAEPLRVRGTEHRLRCAPPDGSWPTKALTALGRACKMVFILQCITDEPRRHTVQLQPNRGEARHVLAHWLFFANRGEFRAGDYEAIMNKASCLGPLSNAAVL